MTAFELEPLTPRLGAEISHIDLRRLDAETFAELYRAWLDYKVVFIRAQDLTLDELLAFSRRFGALLRLPYIQPLAGYPEIIRVLKQADEVDMGVFGGEWHSDFSFLAAPPKASILYAETIPAVGGDTLWADMIAALEGLPMAIRDQIDNRDAIHVGAPYGVRHAPAPDTWFKGSIAIERNNPEADREIRHPVICKHPETGTETLFVNPTYTTRIDGLDAATSKRLLAQVFAHAVRPEYCCRFRWRPGSLAIWDNRSTLHYAVNDYDGSRRCLYRTTIAGAPPRAASEPAESFRIRS